MKKMLLSVLLVMNVLIATAYGAESVDMSGYVRQDVLNERDRAFMAEIQLGNERLFHQIREGMNERFTEIEKQVNAINERTESTNNMLYWILGLLALIVGLPSVQKLLQWCGEKIEERKKQEPFLTGGEIEALKRLLELNKANLAMK